MIKLSDFVSKAKEAVFRGKCRSESYINFYYQQALERKQGNTTLILSKSNDKFITSDKEMLNLMSV